MTAHPTFGSVCSGIEAASEALVPLGFHCAFLSEIDWAARAVLAHRWRARDLRPGRPYDPDAVPIFGDFSSIRIRHLRRFGIALPDVLIGGTPCQSFSVAGKRLSLGDDRGNLALAFVRLAHAIDAARARQGLRGLIVVWENVPGVLSTHDNAFGCFLGGLVGCDAPVVSPLERGRWPDAGLVGGPLARAAWRVLDAQFFGLAQRRERVFVVVSFRDGPDPVRVLFEQGGVRRNPPTRGEARKDLAGTIGGSSQSGGFRTTDLDNNGAFIPETAHPRLAKGNDSFDDSLETYVSAPRLAGGHSNNPLDETLVPGQFLGNPDGFDGEVPFLTSSGIGKQHNNQMPLVGEPIPILEAGARTGREGFEGRDGLGIGEPGDPMFTIQATKQHAVFMVDEQQITSPTNRCQPGEISSTLSEDSRPLVFNSKSDGADAQIDLAPTMRAMEFDESHANGGGQLAVMFKPSHFTRGKDGAPSEIAPPLSADADKGDQDPLVFQTRIARNGRGQPSDVVPALNGTNAGATSDMRPTLAQGSVVRRLTPRECERLFGFPDDHTLVPNGRKLLSSSSRYRLLGASMAVPVIRWIGRRVLAELETKR